MKIENEEIKISSYGLHEMEESATQISIKGEEEMSSELIGEGLEFIGINEWSNLLTNGINRRRGNSPWIAPTTNQIS